MSFEKESWGQTQDSASSQIGLLLQCEAGVEVS